MENLIKDRVVNFPLADIDIRNASDNDLVGISEKMGLGLNLEEMKKIKDYFDGEGRNPTDVELQSIAQAWSEHCCYKSSKVYIRKYFASTNSIEVIDRGDAGVMLFDDEHVYALRIESHNHPSAIEPYGGAATGIGGILRDILCMGCQPVALIDPLFFGNLDTSQKEIPEGTKHPKYLFRAVVSGIRDYGNRVGIPTVSGGLYFHESYLGNCLVNVGCVGVGKKDKIVKNRAEKESYFVLVGGYTGRDGIHGVTFASKVLREETEKKERGAVQLGDPIVKEPLIHAVMECIEKGLLSGMKDLGGGGLSCVIGEMSLAACMGAEVDLEKVHLKERNMAPWEIWISESQERMMLSVKSENLDEVINIFRKWDIPANIIGKCVDNGKILIVRYKGIKVLEISLDFLTKGPEYCRPTAVRKKGQKKYRRPKYDDFKSALLGILSHPNYCSREWVIRQYDYEVRGATVIKPLQGDVRCQTHGDASVIKVLEESFKGLAIAVGFNPEACSIDPYLGGMLIVDEVCRNLASSGARPHSFTDCMNFASPEKPYVMWEFKEVARGIGEMALSLGVPLPSGNVSFYNESPVGGVLPTAVLMGVGIVRDVRKCTTTDFKKKENPIYVLGPMNKDMGGTALYKIFGGYTSRLPRVSPAITKECMDVVIRCIESGYVSACHDISDGGLASAIAEMCIGGGIGAIIDVSSLGKYSDEVLLFYEGFSRYVLEVEKRHEKKFISATRGVPRKKIGRVGGKDMTINNRKKEILSVSVEELRDTWSKVLWEIMG